MSAQPSKPEQSLTAEQLKQLSQECTGDQDCKHDCQEFAEAFAAHKLAELQVKFEAAMASNVEQAAEIERLKIDLHEALHDIETGERERDEALALLEGVVNYLTISVPNPEGLIGAQGCELREKAEALLCRRKEVTK